MSLGEIVTLVIMGVVALVTYLIGKHTSKPSKWNEPLKFTDKYETAKRISEEKRKEETIEVAKKSTPGKLTALREQLDRLFNRKGQ